MYQGRPDMIKILILLLRVFSAVAVFVPDYRKAKKKKTAAVLVTKLEF